MVFLSFFFFFLQDVDQTLEVYVCKRIVEAVQFRTQMMFLQKLDKIMKKLHLQ